MKRLNTLFIGTVIATIALTACNKVKVEEVPVHISLVDDSFRVKQGESVEVDFLRNDNLEGQELSLNLRDESLNGSVSLIEGTSRYLYTANNSFYGNDVFQYEICANGECKTAFVSVKVDPNIVIEDPARCVSMADEDYFETETEEITIPVKDIISNDKTPCSEWAVNSFEIVSEPGNGYYSVTSGNLYFTGYDGWEKDELEYQICNENGDCVKAFIKIYNGNVEVPTQL